MRYMIIIYTIIKIIYRNREIRGFCFLFRANCTQTFANFRTFIFRIFVPLEAFEYRELADFGDRRWTSETYVKC